MQGAEEITKKAKSNLAIALLCLPKQQKSDMITFYAFCRVVDDIADDLDIPAEQRHQQLDHWKNLITQKHPQTSAGPTNELEAKVVELIEAYAIEPQLLVKIIEGCRSDIDFPPRFQTWDELYQYTYKVACCVGLVSIKIFGCKSPQAESYAIELGHALQLTNILRDVGTDLDNGSRIYLPAEVMVQFHYSEDELKNKVYNQAFIDMMNYCCARANQHYSNVLTNTPHDDVAFLKPAESMRRIYTDLLEKMEADQFQVFTKKYTLPKWKKLYHLLGLPF